MEVAAKSPFLNFTPDGFIDYSKIQLKDTTTDVPLWWEVVDWKYFAEWMNRNKHYPLIISAVYFAVIFGIKAFMRNRSPFGLKRELMLWNASLGIFSIVGVVRMAPYFWGRLNQPDGVYKTLCVAEDAPTTIAFWGLAFILSKIVELGDTLFIVLRKKPLQFLQYFHHAMSLTLAWTMGPFLEPICATYVIMNYGVHSLMYPYFAARAMDIHIPRKLANVITLLQFVQMVLGVYINVYTSYLYYYSSCSRHPFTIKMIWISYGSFAVLFGELFYRLVIKKGPSTKAKPE